MTQGSALIVGGGTGIGLAAAHRFVARGMPVGLSGRRADVLAAAREEVLQRHPGAIVEVAAADGAAESQAHEMVRYLAERLGPPSVLVASAGIYEGCDFLDLTEQAWRHTMTTTLDSTVFPAVAAARLMAERGGGRIVLLASTNSFVSEPGSTAYSAAKAAASSLARSLAVDLAKSGIQANAVAPGWIHTGMVDDFVQNATPETLANINPLGRVGLPDEVANLIEYLALDAPDYLTGATVLIDGGQTAAAPLI
ncbi:MAG TPA: SDR family oxidoreductase [Streptosporangiaceae bacterium]|nr:SDR family oxidoreductase [Streptosporangiaceae bacterium]